MKRVVALDLDGVLAQYGDWKGIETIGEPIPGAVEFTKELGKFAVVLIYTSRLRYNPDGKSSPGFLASDDPRPQEELREIVRAWLDKHGFHFSDIWTGPGKPICACIVDDRAVPCEPQIHESAFATALARVSYLCGETKP